MREVGKQRLAHGVLYGLTLTNTSAAACFTKGFPRVQPVTSHGARIGAPARRVHRDALGDTPANAILMGRGTSVSFRVTLNDGSRPGRRCIRAAGLEIFAPSGSRATWVPAGSPACPHTLVTALKPGHRPFRR